MKYAEIQEAASEPSALKCHGEAKSRNLVDGRQNKECPDLREEVSELQICYVVQTRWNDAQATIYSFCFKLRS